MRYVNLSTVLVYRLVSPVVMERFPDYDSLVEAKLMLPHEVERLKKTDEKTTLDKTTWAPMLWAMKLLTKARKEGKVKIEPPVFLFDIILLYIPSNMRKMSSPNIVATITNLGT